MRVPYSLAFIWRHLHCSQLAPLVWWQLCPFLPFEPQPATDSPIAWPPPVVAAADHCWWREFS